MPTEAKKAEVAELVELLSGSHTAIVSDYRGLTVADLLKIRRQLREKGIGHRVVKNRLGRIAAEQSGREDLVPLLVGPSALTTGGADESALARGLLDALRPYRTVEDPRRRPARPDDRRRHRHPAGHPATPRGAAQPAGRRLRIAPQHHGRAARRTAARPGLRPGTAARQARGPRLTARPIRSTTDRHTRPGVDHPTTTSRR